MIDSVDFANIIDMIKAYSNTAGGALLTNFKVMNCIFDTGSAITWGGDENPDSVTLMSNTFINATYEDPVSGTNIIKFGNNPDLGS